MLVLDFVCFYEEFKLKITLARVDFVGIYRTTVARGDGTFGRVKLSIQPILVRDQLDARLQNVRQ